MTDSRWSNEYDQNMTTMNLNNWTWPKLKPTNLNLPTNLLFDQHLHYFWDLLRHCIYVTDSPYEKHIFGGVNLMFVGVMNFGLIPTLMLVGVKIFWSKSNPNWVILNRYCKLASTIKKHFSLTKWTRNAYVFKIYYLVLTLVYCIFRSTVTDTRWCLNMPSKISAISWGDQDCTHFDATKGIIFFWF